MTKKMINRSIECASTNDSEETALHNTRDQETILTKTPSKPTYTTNKM